VSGHVLRVSFHWYRPEMHVECLEPPNAQCHRVCVEGCEEWDWDDHEHAFRQVDHCNVADWINADDAADACAARHEFPLYDGMPITPVWHGDGYRWEPAPLGVGNRDAVVIERGTLDAKTR
jgi:hypothetical protein